ncbi:MAG: SMC family ATPase [Terriglobales bacterium]
MPSSPREFSSVAEGLQAYLRGVLPDSQVTSARIDAEHPPLVLLRTAHLMAAFGFSNGDMGKSYEALYASFKNQYAQQHAEWDALDLAFVFCVRPDTPNLDRFCSNVETDVYFCRKFVVALAEPLGSSLARLPFLPLTPLSGQSLRPASTQTFLQQCGVPAVLAKYLVVQRARGPEGIVEDCTNGEFGEPREFRTVTGTPASQLEPSAESVRIEAVTIKNFRAYRKEQTFALGSDVTVLYGPNGFGKTSFFDAVDFAVTGEIGRVKYSSEAHFKKTAQHLDSQSEESAVSLSFWCNGALRKVTRTVNNRKRALLDNRSTDRKTILGELTGGDIPAADRVENFVSLFRATHLFNQEQQELTKDFQDDCRLSSEIVSRMLAFEDYANAVSKTAKVRGVLQTVIANANAEIKELSEQIADEKKELDRLGQTAKTHANIEALSTEIEALAGKLSASGIAVASQKPDATIVRGWRASLEARLAESQSRSGRLSALAKEAAVLPRTRVDLASLHQQLAEKEQAFDTAEKRRIAAELTLKTTEQRLAEINVRCAETQTRVEILEWVRATKPVYAQLTEKQRTINDELNRATDALAQHQAAEENATSDLREQDNLAAQAAEKLKAKRVELTALQNLNESTTSWQVNRARLAAVVQSEQVAVKSLESLRVEARELAPQVIALAAEEARISRQVAQVDTNQSELKNLLSQLLGHVRTGVCPVCGEDHGSKDALVHRIQNHITADAASGARAELSGVRERVKQLAERVADNKQKEQATDTQLASLKRERARLEAEIGQFANSAVKLGIILEAPGPSPAEQLQTLNNRLQQEIAELNQQIKEVGVAAETMRTELANTKTLVAAKAAEMADRKGVLSRLEGELSRLRDDPRLTQFSLDMGDEQLADLERLNREQLSELKAEAVKAQTETTQEKVEASKLRQESTSLKAQLPTLRSQIGNLQRTLTQITARFKESKLPSDASEEMLLRLIAEESRSHAKYLALRDSVSNLELAIDAATTSAALTQLLQNVRNKEKAVATAARQRDRHQPWLKYFEELSRLVSSQQNQAIASFTRDYGPRTSVIQRRLRSVYGFDDIEIRSEESAIIVRVKRHGEQLRPTDYFSQSQQQTLFLGLFLTACISQTWSAFSPIFLDDPVTHFDDLNTYAFLDLIVGLLEPNLGRRQFVISTCDEKLLQIARQKFRHLGERAKFYRFSAISAEGPVVDEVASS